MVLKEDNSFPVALSGGGEMGGRIRSVDWALTPLGQLERWPKTLQSALGICLNSNFPIAIYWGPDLVLLYNDAWSPIPGNKHPQALGRLAREVWPEIWDDIEPQFQKAFNGIPGGSKDALLPMQRHGYTEECYFDFTFTPIYGESGRVEGVFNAVIETTYRLINERRSFCLQRLAAAVSAHQSIQEVLKNACLILDQSSIDIPYYVMYRMVDHQIEVICASEGLDLSPSLLDSLYTGSGYVSDVEAITGTLPPGHWPEKSKAGYIVRINKPDGETYAGLLFGISPRRAFDQEYKAYFESFAGMIGAEVNTILALEKERMRSEALAELDRAKTIFFSNISHEFRTPLTLMMSPLEAVLATSDNLLPDQKSNIEASYRNTLRLQRLVNTLLDFSRLEAGRMQINFELTDIGEITRDLASTFRSAIQKAGLELNVTIEPFPLLAKVDISMWEKIVLNLLSNAFKYTKEGAIHVSVRREGKFIAVTVADTGVGIAEKDLSKIFERFYRVNSDQGRSQEGTGIGLAMVKELVGLHHGSIDVRSNIGEGSTFTVKIPAEERADVGSSNGKHTVSANDTGRAFIEDAQLWTGSDNPVSPRTDRETLPRVLIADDNADMRNYLERLLQSQFNVKTVSDGEQAWNAALEWIPDLIISDIMMPMVDGFALLKRLKSRLVSRNIPVIFLSARAGEESRVEGIDAGADDYLVKPFSAKELLARVSNHIAIANTRRKTEKEFYNLFLQSPAHIHVMRGPDHVVDFFHPLAIPFIGRDITGMRIKEALPQLEGQGFFEMLDKVYQEGVSYHLPEAKAVLPDKNGVPVEYFFSITYLPWRDVAGKVQGVLQFSFEVTETVKQRLKAEASELNFRAITEKAPVAICVLKGPEYLIDTVNTSMLLLWGKDLSEVQGRPIAEVLPEMREKNFVTALDTVLTSGKQSHTYETALNVTRNGKHSQVILNFIYQPLLNAEAKVEGIIVVGVDVTEQVHARREIEEAEYKLQNAVELADLGTWHIFLDTDTVEYSKRTAEWYGLSEEGDTLANHLSCIAPEDRERVKDAKRKAIESRGVYNSEYRLINKKTGQVRFIQAKGTVFTDAQNRPVRLSGIVRDVTIFKSIQDELEKQVSQRTAELVSLNADLSRTNENLRQFAYVASHDLQEPLRKIQTFTGMVTDRLGDETFVKNYLQKIRNAAARMSALIKDVLLYSQVSRTERTEMIDLNEVLLSVRNDFELLIEQKRASIISDPLPVIKGYRLHYHQLFSNLIGNSLKFAEREPVIEIRVTEVRVPDGPAGQPFFQLTFTDNGIGFEQEYADQIFGMFTRLHNRQDVSGTGIGLALCKKIVEGYGGSIAARSTKGVGTTFIVLLPHNS